MPDDLSTRAGHQTEPDAESAEELRRVRAELKQARAALASTERQLFELRAQRSATMARLERQTYWLERGRIDLDTWMRRAPLFIAFRLFSAVLRGWTAARRLR